MDQIMLPHLFSCLMTTRIQGSEILTEMKEEFLYKLCRISTDRSPTVEYGEKTF